MSSYTIKNASLADLENYRECLGKVAAERRWIGFVEAPSVEHSRQWMESVLAAAYPFLLAFQDQEVVGWCDVGQREREGFRHTAELGMGLLPSARGHGLGSRLLAGAIDNSRRIGVEKLELQVYSSNVAARRLYEKFGFIVEGSRRRARKLDGKYDDIILMGLFLADDK